MTPPRARLRRRLLAVVALSLACGCGDSVGPCHAVEGGVRVDGKPLRGMTGFVTFLPDKARGNNTPFSPRGELDREGRYTLSTKGKPGAPPGWYKVVLTAMPPGAERDNARLAINLRYTVEKTTPLTREVVADPAPGAYDLDLKAR